MPEEALEAARMVAMDVRDEDMIDALGRYPGTGELPEDLARTLDQGMPAAGIDHERGMRAFPAEAAAGPEDMDTHARFPDARSI
jgi:hypothetical protein